MWEAAYKKAGTKQNHIWSPKSRSKRSWKEAGNMHPHHAHIHMKAGVGRRNLQAKWG